VTAVPKEQQFTVTVHDEEGHVAAFRQIKGYGAFGVLQQLVEQVSQGVTDYGVVGLGNAPIVLPVPMLAQKVWVVLSLETDPGRIEYGEVRAVNVLSEPPSLVESHHSVYECDVDGGPKAYRSQ
jgi:hypothetical protein